MMLSNSLLLLLLTLNTSTTIFESREKFVLTKPKSVTHYKLDKVLTLHRHPLNTMGRIRGFLLAQTQSTFRHREYTYYLLLIEENDASTLHLNLSDAHCCHRAQCILLNPSIFVVVVVLNNSCASF